MRLQYTKMERAAGAFILLTVLIFVLVVSVVGRGKNWFRKHVTYYTTFNEGYNLKSGSRVKLFGTDVGKVAAVRLTKDNRVRIKIRILAAYASRIRADSIAIVQSPTFIGSEFIAIMPGSMKAPPIPPGGEIPSKERKKLSEYLEEYEVGKTLKSLREIVGDLAVITARLQREKGPLFGTLTNIQRLTGAIEAGEGTLGRLVRRDELYRQITAELDTISKILTSVQKTVANTQEMSKNLQRASQYAPEMTTRVQELLERMLKVSALMEKAMGEAPEISRQARAGMHEVNRILDAVKRNFLIRHYLSPPPAAESHGVELRGE